MSGQSLHFHKQRGQALLFITLSLPVIFGMLGLVVDVGWMYWRREACLTAAQSAATAAAIYMSKNYTAYPVGCTGQAWCSSTATSCSSTVPTTPTSEFDVACEYANANGFANSNSRQNVLVAANNGTSTLTSNITTLFYVNVTASEKVPLTFLATIAKGYFGLASASATGAITAASTTTGGCVYLIDPQGNSLNASNDAQIHSNCGVYDYSKDPAGGHAVTIVGSACVSTVANDPNCTSNGTAQGPIDIVGTDSVNNGGHINPAATTVSAPANLDPLSNLDTPWCSSSNGYTCPSVSCNYTGCNNGTACQYTKVNLSAWQASPYVLNPGVYCGDASTPAISVSNGNSVTFNPGMYVINGGGINITSGSQDSGTGVVFYMTGSASTYGGFRVSNGVSGLSLTAPTTGDLTGVLIYEDRNFTPTGANATTSFQGGATSAMNGIIYLPDSTASFGNGTSTTAQTSLVAKDAIFNGGSYVFNPSTSSSLTGSTTVTANLVGSH